MIEQMERMDGQEDAYESASFSDRAENSPHEDNMSAEDNEYEDDYPDEETVTGIPECPYCCETTGECAHVLLNYDASFGEYLSGYLSEHCEEINELKVRLLELLRIGHQPGVKRGHLKEIWTYAAENHLPEATEAELDETAYFNLLREIIDDFGGEYVQYNDEEGTPGYSSSYLIFFAKAPETTIKEMNTYITDQLAEG